MDGVTGSLGFALGRTPLNHVVHFGRPPIDGVARHRVRMHVDRAIGPHPLPGRVIHDDDMGVPGNVGRAPAPWRERRADGHAEAVADRAVDDDAGPRRRKHDDRIVVGHHDHGGIDRSDFDIRSGMHGDVGVGLQVAVGLRPLAHALDRIHHLGLLGEKRRADLFGPRHVGRHHAEHGRKRQQRLHRWVPGQPIRVHRVHQRLAGQIVMLVGPLCRRRNVR